MGDGGGEANTGMSKRTLRFTDDAIADLVRLRAFLQDKNPAAAERSARAIAHALRTLEAQPEIGRPLDLLPGCRELLIAFGVAGYIAPYRVTDEHVVVLPLRHQGEAGYR